MNKFTALIIADNQDISRAGLHYLINRSIPHISVKDVSNKQELISAMNECSGIVIVILDYTLFDIHSIDELLVIGKRYNNSRWILFSNELSENIIRRLSSEPTIGILLKENSEDEIISALKHSISGERFICHQIKNLLSSGTRHRQPQSILTATETDILRLIALGKSAKEIAFLRNSSTHTIITHKKNIFRKIEVNNIHEATKYALRAGLVEMMEYYI